MANYVYNDNFSNFPDEKPTPKSKAKFNKKTIMTLCIVGLCVFMALNILIGIWIGNAIARKHPVNAINTSNTIYTAPPSDKLASNNLSIADVAQNVQASVVEIKTEFLSHTTAPEAVKSGAGSGVIFGTYLENNSLVGYNIVTCLHVIQDRNAQSIASSIEVTLHDGTSYTASVVGYDTDYQLAVLRIKESKKNLTCATFATVNSVRVGDAVIAIGNPLTDVGSSLTYGIVSSGDKKIKTGNYSTMTLMQANITVNPGNSGGGLFDMNGRLVGIVNTRASASNIDGIAFAASASIVQKACSDIAQYGYVQNKPYIGVEFKKYLDATVRVEGLVQGYNENSLKKGDRILSVNGNKILDGAQIFELVKDCTNGDVLMFVVLRDNVELAVAVTVYNYQPN